MGAKWSMPPDRETLTQVLVRMSIAVALYGLRSVEGVRDVFADTGALAFAIWGLKGLVGWIRTADWAYDTQLTAAGNRTAPARREEARELSAAIRAERRRVKERRRLERARARARG